MAKNFSIDLAMTLLFIALLGFHHTGGFAHEWMGLAFFGLAVAHAILNLSWYKRIFKGPYEVRRCISTILNVLLVVGLLVISISGILNSSHVFKMLRLDGGMGIRQVHSVSAYWGLVLLGVHAGLYWKRVGLAPENRLAKNVLRLLALVAAVYGIWASFDRGMGAKLFLGASFDFWNPDRHIFLFYASYMAIMSLYIFITHHIAALKPPGRTR